MSADVAQNLRMEAESLDVMEYEHTDFQSVIRNMMVLHKTI